MREKGPDADDPRSGAARGDDRPGGGSATVTRRQFAAGAGAALLLPVAARLSPWATGDAGAGRVTGVLSGPGPDAGGPRRRAQEGQEEPPGTEALLDYVEARWGDRLSEDEREQVRSSIAGNLRAASALDEVDLGNGDGPALRFHPYRGSESP